MNLQTTGNNSTDYAVRRMRKPFKFIIRERERILYPLANPDPSPHPKGPAGPHRWTGQFHKTIGFDTLKEAKTFVEKRCQDRDVVIFEVSLNPVANFKPNKVQQEN